MTLIRRYKQYFTVSSLNELYNERIVYSGASGIDQLDHACFAKQLDEQIDILSRKTIDGSYQFSKYKLKLISKGRGKAPREISIPTIRDRLALRSLCDFLTEVYQDSVEFQLPQNIIKDVKSEFANGGYSGCIKLDVTNFYPSIKHEELISRLGRKIRTPQIKQYIRSAISSPTVSVSRKSDAASLRGVPQGLAISNILAAIYLLNIDKRLNSYPNIKYYRYVDDVLIFCDRDEAEVIAKFVVGEFRKIGLKIHDPIKSPEKSSIGRLAGGFDYLGYKFSKDLVTPRPTSVHRLRESLISTITNYKYAKNKNKGFLLWRLNLRITGCVHDNKSKGWLFFFAEINDESLLHSLDHFVKKMLERFGIEIEPKKFVRSYKEISHRKHETNYIPNFDSYSLDQMKSVLEDYFGLSVSGYTSQQIEYSFKKRISKQVKDMQVDFMDFS